VGTPREFAIPNLQFSICNIPWRAVSPPARSDGTARQKRAKSSPGRFSRTASLLHRAAARTGRPAPSRKTNWEKSLREKYPVSGGQIIRTPARRIKAGWPGYPATQVLICQGIVARQRGIRFAGGLARPLERVLSPAIAAGKPAG